MTALRAAIPAQVAIVEDAAHALGASYPDGSPVGSSGNLTCFSFYANKNLSTGDGGAVAVRDRVLAEKVRLGMPTVFNAAHVICLPSYREGLPKVLLEAMACGKACIATDVPGCRDAVRNEDNGLLVPAKDAKALAAAIRWLLENPEERERMGARGRERAVEEFRQERVIAATLAVYREVLT